MNKPIPALTLWQPWADLMALGLKRIETRSWRTSYRGPLFIHAAAKKVDMEWIEEEQAALKAAFAANPEAARRVDPRSGGTTWRHWLESMSYGAIIALVDVVNCCRTETIFPSLFIAENSDPEQSFGNYSPGRWGWMTENCRMLTQPVPCKGQRLLWTPGPDIQAAAMQALGAAHPHPQEQEGEG